MLTRIRSVNKSKRSKLKGLSISIGCANGSLYGSEANLLYVMRMDLTIVQPDKKRESMLADFVTQVLTSAIFSSILVGSGVWLVRSWLSERMKNAIRSEYDQKLETHKAQLKAQSDVALERVRADLSIAAAERQIQFERLHEERAEVIAETYARLTELHTKLGDYVKIFEPAGDKPREERRQAVQEAHKAFITYYPKKRIFLPELAVAKIDSINERSVSAFYSFFYEIDVIQEQGGHAAKRWLEIFNQVKDDIPVALKELERDFRALLGDKGEQGHSADAPAFPG